jgi:hypothetical protein
VARLASFSANAVGPVRRLSERRRVVFVIDKAHDRASGSSSRTLAPRIVTPLPPSTAATIVVDRCQFVITGDVANIMAKLGVHSRARIAAWAVEQLHSSM